MQLKSKAKLLGFVLLLGLVIFDFIVKYGILYILDFVFSTQFTKLVFGNETIPVFKGYLLLSVFSIVGLKRWIIFNFDLFFNNIIGGIENGGQQ